MKIELLARTGLAFVTFQTGLTGDALAAGCPAITVANMHGVGAGAI